MCQYGGSLDKNGLSITPAGRKYPHTLASPVGTNLGSMVGVCQSINMGYVR